MDEHAYIYLSNEELESIFSPIMEQKLALLRAENELLKRLVENSRECVRRSLKA